MAKHKADSQMSLILGHLKENREINPIIALNLYGCYRLGAIIFNLKAEGHLIESRIEKYTKPSGKRGRYAVYRLEESNGII